MLGCGPIAPAAHFDACRRARNADLYAICDVAEDLVARMAGAHQPQVAYLNYDEMLADSRLEAVIVAISDQFHIEAARKAITAGKHVLVEKPLGVTLEECEELRKQVQASGLLLQVGTMKRFDPGIAFAQRFIREEMGEMLALKAWYCDSTYRYQMTDTLQPIIVTSEQARKPPGDPKADKRRYYLLTHGSHLVDTTRFLGGEIVAVQARRIEKFGAYCWFVAVEFADGSAGHLDLTMAVRMDWHEGFQIYGEYGSVIGKTYNPWYLRSSDVECFSARDGQYHRVLGKVVIDAANLVNAHEPEKMRQTLDEAFDLLGEHIVLAHAKDRASDDSFCVAGEGILDYAHYLRLLQSVGFRGPLILHSLDETQVDSAVAFLRNL